MRPLYATAWIYFAIQLSFASAWPLSYSSEQSQSKLRPLALTIIRVAGKSCTVISLSSTQQHRLLTNKNDTMVERRLSGTTSEYLQIIGHTAPNLWTTARDLCPDLIGEETQGRHSHMVQHEQHVFSASRPLKKPSLEIHPLVVSGPSQNRVDLTFFSDGYTIHERDKFLADAYRLAIDMSQNQTFATVQPLMNFWAAFSPSQESGIGVAGTPKDTVFGLYRDGTELRAVYCSKKDVARDACLSLQRQCDYPILLGNDPLYGGLGGEFTISTVSNLNGASVLRHELGHSIIGVGEEYDGGFAYFGVNTVQNISQGDSPGTSAFKWSHWLSTPLMPEGTPRAERASMPFQAYPWTLLNRSSPWSGSFSSSGLYSRHLVRFSLSGLPETEDMKVHLDGVDLGWKPYRDIGLDRWHYDIHCTQALSNGRHDLTFTLGESAQDGTAQLCSAEIIEYGDETEFNGTIGYYGAFPTFSEQNITTFRPTNEQCLMRIVTSPNFCSVCMEGLWLSLLKRVDLIDDLFVTFTSAESMVLELVLVPLGELRSPSIRGHSESYAIVWEKNGISLPQFANSTRIVIDDGIYGIWRASVQLHTVEVKVDSDGLLKSHVVVGISPQTDQSSVGPGVSFIVKEDN